MISCKTAGGDFYSFLTVQPDQMVTLFLDYDYTLFIDFLPENYYIRYINIENPGNNE